ncbi:MAG: hypothetical protein FWH33_07940 [Oscillospiraceae bacterium]|nr:hypothetical protein [Oscillospiraceae bacterium]
MVRSAVRGPLGVGAVVAAHIVARAGAWVAAHIVARVGAGVAVHIVARAARIAAAPKSVPYQFSSSKLHIFTHIFSHHVDIFYYVEYTHYMILQNICRMEWRHVIGIQINKLQIL